MNITSNMATKIVTEINNIIEQRVNIMNIHGVIISSTDQSRVGQFHEGAKKLIEQGLDELVIDNDDEYSGTKKGINFPIMVNRKISGVIGITGKYEEVIKYAQLIKKLTEILLIDASVNEQKIIRQNIITNYLHEWISRNQHEINKTFIDRGLELNIDITIPRRIVVVSLTQNITKSYDGKLQLLYNAEQSISELLYSVNEKNLFIKTSTDVVCCFTYMDDEKIYKICNYIKDTIFKKYDISISIGIDEDYSDSFNMQAAYAKAKKALIHSVKSISEIRFYKDLKFEIFIDEISYNSKKDFVYRIFKGFSNEEIKENLYYLEILYRFNGSISLASEHMHMHKNTLQYKLKKIYEKTHYDPRCISESGIFQLAIIFSNQIM